MNFISIVNVVWVSVCYGRIFIIEVLILKIVLILILILIHILVTVVLNELPICFNEHVTTYENYSLTKIDMKITVIYTPNVKEDSIKDQIYVSKGTSTGGNHCLVIINELLVVVLTENLVLMNVNKNTILQLDSFFSMYIKSLTSYRISKEK